MEIISKSGNIYLSALQALQKASREHWVPFIEECLNIQSRTHRSISSSRIQSSSATWRPSQSNPTINNAPPPQLTCWKHHVSRKSTSSEDLAEPRRPVAGVIDDKQLIRQPSQHQTHCPASYQPSLLQQYMYARRITGRSFRLSRRQYKSYLLTGCFVDPREQDREICVEGTQGAYKIMRIGNATPLTAASHSKPPRHLGNAGIGAMNAATRGCGREPNTR